jgi:two-component sensor histidine kinase
MPYLFLSALSSTSFLGDDWLTYMNIPSVSSDLLVAERDILTRVAAGGPLPEVMRDIILLVEKPSNGEMLASILLTSEDGRNLVEGAAPSLPEEYNAAINGIPVAHGVGSCGTAAFTGHPVIVADIATDPLWADYRELAHAHGLRACWSMPIVAADGRVLGTFANYYREPKAPTERDLEVIGMVTRTAAIAIERYRHELSRQRAEEQRILLLRELNHRVKNVFALTNSLLTMTARSAGSVEELCSSVQGRLHALSRAHELVQSGFGIDEGLIARDVSLRELLDNILAPYAHEGRDERIVVTGAEAIQISSKNITSIALVLHELATNAAKYGALREEAGRLDVSCDQADGIRIKWSERLYGDTAPPSRSGFGSTLVKRSIEGIGGAISYEWSAEGLDIEIRLPSGALAGASS